MKLSNESECFVKAYLHWLVQHKPDSFANGREMRNLFELAVSNIANRLGKAGRLDQAGRLAEQTDISDDELSEITKADLPEWVIHPRNNRD